MTTKSIATEEAARNAIVADIAKRMLWVDTLETRNRDIHDFHNVAVWSIREALEEAFNQGFGYGRATK